MSKTYEALKKAEAEKNRKMEEKEHRDSGAQESIQPPEAAQPSPEGASITREESPSSPSVLTEGETKETPEPAETTINPGPPHTNGHILTPSPTVEEQYQRLYTNIAIRGQAQQIRTLMIVGAHHGDGVTTSASLFARALAKSRTVLLVDANLRTPALADIFHVRANGGFADFLARKVSLDGAISETDVPNLFVMTSGSPPLAPPYLFEIGPFDELLTDLKAKFDYIIFDAAPLAAHLDSTFLASRVDGVLLVIKAEATQIRTGQEIKKKLDDIGARTLGVVVNQTRNYVPPFLHRLLA
jgi:capsular exopolysaccharide synthesis family protein